MLHVAVVMLPFPDDALLRPSVLLQWSCACSFNNDNFLRRLFTLYSAVQSELQDALRAVTRPILAKLKLD